MNGEYANLCNLAASARFALKNGSFDYTVQKYVISEEFVFLPRKTGLFSCNHIVAKNSDMWFKELLTLGLVDVIMMLPLNSSSLLHCFSNSSGGCVLCFFKSGKVTFFAPRWTFNNKERGWEIVFTENNCDNPLESKPVFSDNTMLFGQTLAQIAEFAERIDEKYWADVFREAKRILDGELELSVSNDIPEKIMRLAYAAAKSDVFGAMGSWNDSPAYSAMEKGFSEEFNRLSGELFEHIKNALMYAVNEI